MINWILVATIQKVEGDSKARQLVYVNSLKNIGISLKSFRMHTIKTNTNSNNSMARLRASSNTLT